MPQTVAHFRAPRLCILPSEQMIIKLFRRRIQARGEPRKSTHLDMNPFAKQALQRFGSDVPQSCVIRGCTQFVFH